MKLISHRGNIFGPNKEDENKIEYIEKSLSEGFDVEIDLRHKDHNFYLGHDEPQYHVPISWLFKWKDRLWIHCKDFKSLDVISNSPVDFHYFCHESDKHTLTSKGYIWSYPGQPYTLKSVIVMPESNDLLKFSDNDKMIDVKEYNCYAICSDYVGKMI